MSPRCLLPSFEWIGLSAHEKKRKIDFQDGHHGGQLGFPIRKTLAIFHLQVSLMLPTKFQVDWPFDSGEEAKNRFSRSMAAILDVRSERFMLFLIYKSPWCCLPSFESIGRLVQEKKRKIDFQDGRHGISDRNDFSYFWSTSHPNASYQVSSQLALAAVLDFRS